MESVISELKKMSIFGRDLQFEKDYNNKFVSLSSLLLTLIVLIATIIAGFIFGKEIYERKTPKFATFKTPVPYTETKFFLEDIPMLMSFRTSFGRPISDEDIKKIISFRISIATITEGVANVTTKEIQKCNLTDFTDEDKKKVLEAELLLPEIQYYCISPKEYVLNKRSATNSQGLIIYIDKCVNNCIPDLDNLIEGMFSSFSYVNSYVDPSDYNNTIKYYFEKTSLKINKKVSKEIAFSFTRNSIVTNKGWIFSDYFTQHYVSLDSISRDVFLSDKNLMTIRVDSPLIVDHSTREYIKIQDLMANIGGFFNAAYIIISFFFTNFIKFEYYVYIHQTFVKYDEPNKENKMNESQNKILMNNYVNNNLRNNSESNNRRNNHENINSQGVQKNEEEIGEGKSEEVKDKDQIPRKRITLKKKDIEENDEKEINEETSKKEGQEKDNTLKKIREDNPIPEINSVDDSLVKEENISYLNYVYNDIVCFRKKYVKVIENSQTLLSFNNYLSVAFFSRNLDINK